MLISCLQSSFITHPAVTVLPDSNLRAFVGNYSLTDVDYGANSGGVQTYMCIPVFIWGRSTCTTDLTDESHLLSNIFFYKNKLLYYIFNQTVTTEVKEGNKHS